MERGRESEKRKRRWEGGGKEREGRGSWGGGRKDGHEGGRDIW